MGFDPGIKIGDKLSNEEMYTLFKCANTGGMRPSKKTGTLVIVSDDTKGQYGDKWVDGILHYTGTGREGDQKLERQNKILYYSDTNGVDVHLFIVEKAKEYIYWGIVKLAGEPYQEEQEDINKHLRKVWMFPVKPIAEFEGNLEKDLTEKEIIRLSNRQLARRSAISKVDKTPKTTETTVYYRDPYLKEIVKRIAEGKCQYCGNDAPFIDKNGVPYLEEHHVKRLADGGTDTIDNVVAICPNCHRRMHVLNNEADVLILEAVAEQNERRAARFIAYGEEM